MSLKIVQDLSNQFKHFINKNIHLVLVVGGVDSVDNTNLPPHLGSISRIPLDVVPDPVFW
jgi:hypothetical protein